MSEDAATVLEHFVNDIANLPAEIAHIYEEIQAKDKLLKEQRDSALARDNSLQKHIRLHGSHVENPKEAIYVEQIRKSQKRVMEIQEEKVALAQKALDLMDKHLKRLDTKITNLMNEGLMPPDSIQPSAAPSNIPTTTHHRQPSMRASPSIPPHHSRVPSHSSSAHNTPAAQPHSPAATPTFTPPIPTTSRDLQDAKRRRLTGPSGGSSTPAISSNLANSHPSTPGIKSEPSGTRAGTPSATISVPKKSSRKSAAQMKRERVSASVDVEDDDDDEDDDEDEAGEDKRLYCTCQQVSYGNMVACDDSDCPFEWFHWACVNLTKEPPGKWFCPTCAAKRVLPKPVR